MKFQREYTKEEIELNKIFFNDELMRISDIVKLITQTAYIYNFKQQKFTLSKEKIKILNIELTDKEQDILNKSDDLYLFTEKLHDMFIDNHSNNLNVGAFIDWCNKLQLESFSNSKDIDTELYNTIDNCLANINLKIYDSYHNAYKRTLNKMIINAHEQCLKTINRHKSIYIMSGRTDETNFKKLDEDDKNRLYFENKISELMGLDKDELHELFYEVHNHIEFDIILTFVENMNEIKVLPNKDPKHHARDTKGKFNNAKDKFINTLKELGFNNEVKIIEQQINYQVTPLIEKNFEDTKKHYKNILYTQLKENSTPIRRIKEIIKITNYFNS